MHMWTASALQEAEQWFGSDRLRSYVRPVCAAAYDRWPRWFSATRVPNTIAAFSGRCICRSVSCFGSIDHTNFSFLACSASTQHGRACYAACCELNPITGLAGRYRSPLTMSFQAMRAFLFANATAANFGGFRLSRSISQGEPVPRCRTRSRTEVDPTTKTLRSASSPARLIPPSRDLPAVE